MANAEAATANANSSNRARLRSTEVGVNARTERTSELLVMAPTGCPIGHPSLVNKFGYSLGTSGCKKVGAGLANAAGVDRRPADW